MTRDCCKKKCFDWMSKTPIRIYNFQISFRVFTLLELAETLIISIAIYKRINLRLQRISFRSQIKPKLKISTSYVARKPLTPCIDLLVKKISAVWLHVYDDINTNKQKRYRIGKWYTTVVTYIFFVKVKKKRSANYSFSLITLRFFEITLFTDGFFVLTLFRMLWHNFLF